MCHLSIVPAQNRKVHDDVEKVAEAGGGEEVRGGVGG